MRTIVLPGPVPFAEALALQERLVEEIATGKGEETLLLLEHEPVFTTGRGRDERHLLDPAVKPVEINRGGDVTWHGPGQLVAYPLIHAGRRGFDLHRILRFLEEVLIRTAEEYRIAAHRVAGRTGVWCLGGKLASIGIGVRRRVVMHGVALNVDPDLAQFSRIDPCGIPGCPVTSLARECGYPLPLPEVRERFMRIFAELLPELLPEDMP